MNRNIYLRFYILVKNVVLLAASTTMIRNTVQHLRIEKIKIEI